jgi:hypothetical protein
MIIGSSKCFSRDLHENPAMSSDPSESYIVKDFKMPFR